MISSKHPQHMVRIHYTDGSQKSKIMFLASEKYCHFYTNHIETCLTVIQPIIKDINLCKDELHVITKNQFPI